MVAFTLAWQARNSRATEHELALMLTTLVCHVLYGTNTVVELHSAATGPQLVLRNAAGQCITFAIGFIGQRMFFGRLNAKQVAAVDGDVARICIARAYA